MHSYSFDDADMVHKECNNSLFVLLKALSVKQLCGSVVWLSIMSVQESEQLVCVTLFCEELCLESLLNTECSVQKQNCTNLGNHFVNVAICSGLSIMHATISLRKDSESGVQCIVYAYS